jgi:REP element-mobilizing transposase RayT
VLGRPIFLTLHVRGAIPKSAAKAIHEKACLIEQSNPSGYFEGMRVAFREMEKWLDRVEFNPVLKVPEVALMLIAAMKDREERGFCRVLQGVVMPNHIHILYLAGHAGMKKFMRGYKQWTSRQANRILNRTEGRFWQSEWFDHWSRSDEETSRLRKYIRLNPVRAGLVKDSKEWPYFYE